ncbi:MAG: efflux RND transporter permease subunit [Gammaproteobacteria bacterium]|nr:efflux RND transporter permease subunit [Gammaproteobacteria bacterium]
MTDLAGGQIDTPVQKGLISYFANNIVAANLIMGLLLIGGLLSGLSLTAQTFPTVDPGIITVTVPYPGATPTEVEEGITRRVEEAVFGIEGVDRVISRASENTGTITIELDDFIDGRKILDDVKSAVDRIADFPPGDAEEPDIVRQESTNEIIALFVSSDGSEQHLRHGAEHLEQALLTLPTVSMVDLLGGRDYEISIEVAEDSLRQFGLTIDQVANAVRSSSVNLASGELRTESGDLLLRTNTKRETGEEFENIVLLAKADGTFLRLGDIATIRDGFVDTELINEFNGRAALFLQVRASESEDTLTIARDIKNFLAHYEPPEGITAGIWVDQSDILSDRLSLLLRNGTLGFALVFLFLVVMLDLRLAIWVAMGVPISFLGAFLFFDFLDVNINMVSLFALIIVLGIVVDDAVVVGENIIAEQEAGHRGVVGAFLGVKGVIGPVVIGVLTTMAAFAPLLFVTGMFGQMLGIVPVVVITVLAMSLIEAFFILPAHLAHGNNWSRWPLDVMQGLVGRALVRFRDQVIIPLITVGLRFRYYSLGAAFVFLILCGALLATGTVRFIFFPVLESTSMRANLAFPVGTPFETTKSAAEKIVDAAHSVNTDVGGTAFKSVIVTIGGQTQSDRGPQGGSQMSIASHIASVQIELNPEPLRTHSTTELERLWRNRVGMIPGVESISYSSEFFRFGSDLEYELTHYNDDILNLAVESLKSSFAEFPSIYDIQDSLNPGKRQYDIELTAAGEAAGLTPAIVARQLRRSFFGEEVQRIQRGREELKVMIRYPESQRRSTQDLYNTRIRLGDGTEAPLEVVARLKESRSYASIDRVDGIRIVSVTAEIDTSLATPTEVTAKLESEVLPALIEQYPGLTFKQAGTGQQQTEDLGTLGYLALIALLVIFALLASELKSYVQPFIIMAAIPFGAAGALLGHYLLGYTLSFVSIFGMIALSGVVVNDSLILIDRYNHYLRETDMNSIEAIVAAIRRRFRAVVLTSATTALGLTPMLFETSTQAQFLIPMAVSLAVGIVFATVVILFLVPVLVLIREDIHRVSQHT